MQESLKKRSQARVSGFVGAYSCGAAASAVIMRLMIFSRGFKIESFSHPFESLLGAFF
jgi:hypothetical protein